MNSSVCFEPPTELRYSALASRVILVGLFLKNVQSNSGLGYCVSGKPKGGVACEALSERMEAAGSVPVTVYAPEGCWMSRAAWRTSTPPFTVTGICQLKLRLRLA